MTRGYSDPTYAAARRHIETHAGSSHPTTRTINANDWAIVGPKGFHVQITRDEIAFMKHFLDFSTDNHRTIIGRLKKKAAALLPENDGRNPNA